MQGLTHEPFLMQHGAMPVPGTTGSCAVTTPWTFQATEPDIRRFQQVMGDSPCETVPPLFFQAAELAPGSLPMHYQGRLMPEDGREVASPEGILCTYVTS